MAHPKTNIINEKTATSTIIGVVPAPVTRSKHLRPTGPPQRPHPERIIREDQVGSVKFPCKYYHSHVGCFHGSLCRYIHDQDSRPQQVRTNAVSDRALLKFIADGPHDIHIEEMAARMESQAGRPSQMAKTITKIPDQSSVLGSASLASSGNQRSAEVIGVRPAKAQRNS